MNEQMTERKWMSLSDLSKLCRWCKYVGKQPVKFTSAGRELCIPHSNPDSADKIVLISKHKDFLFFST